MLDVRTLILANFLLSVFLGAGLLYYRVNQKTYAGFGLGIIGILSIAAGYVSMLLRDYAALWVSIVLTNFFVVLSFTLWLDASLLFMKGRRLDRRLYLLPFLAVLLLLYFCLVRDSITTRNLILTAFLIILSGATGAVFLSARIRRGLKIRKWVGILFILVGLLLMGRALSWLSNPDQGLLGSGLFQSFFFIGALLLNVGIVTGALMLNSHRLEEELITSREELDRALSDLKASLAEVKTLSGLLPICTHCKKIRDDQGYWQLIEKYIQDHSEAGFTHSICPDCLKTHYPDFADD